MKGHQYRWLAWWLWPGNRTFLEVASMVGTWWIVAFWPSDYATVSVSRSGTGGLACITLSSLRRYFQYKCIKKILLDCLVKRTPGNVMLLGLSFLLKIHIYSCCYILHTEQQQQLSFIWCCKNGFQRYYSSNGYVMIYGWFTIEWGRMDMLASTERGDIYIKNATLMVFVCKMQLLIFLVLWRRSSCN